MFHRCIMCEEMFFECDLLEERCIECWHNIAKREISRNEKSYLVDQAEGRGCIAAHEHLVDQGRRDIESLVNPYDVDTQNYEYCAWCRGRDRRYGEYLKFLERQVLGR